MEGVTIAGTERLKFSIEDTILAIQKCGFASEECHKYPVCC